MQTVNYINTEQETKMNRKKLKLIASGFSMWQHVIY